MLAWMLYVVVVTILLSGAALAAERSAGAPGADALAMGREHHRLAAGPHHHRLGVDPDPQPLERPRPRGSKQAHSAAPDDLRGPGAIGLAHRRHGADFRAPGLDVMLERTGWIVASAALFLAILFSGAQLHRRKRHWDRRTIAGVPVYVSEDVGPAVVGLLHPQIVVPRWIAGAAPETQKLVLAHEQSHLDADDARLLAIAVLLIVTMPWNLPLWWQLWRLRFAIEVDCDARVLKGGHDVSRYGQTLIMVGERQSTSIAVVAAMSEIQIPPRTKASQDAVETTEIRLGLGDRPGLPRRRPGGQRRRGQPAERRSRRQVRNTSRFPWRPRRSRATSASTSSARTPC